MEELQRKIFQSLESNNFEKANEDMLQFCNMLSEDLTQESIDAYINLFFTKGSSIITYFSHLFKADVNLNNYQSISTCLNTVFILLNNFPKNMNDHINVIINLSLKIIDDPKLSKFKAICAQILYLIITHTNSSQILELDETTIIYIFTNVKKRLSNETSTKTLGNCIKIIGALSCNKHLQSQAKREEIANCLVNFVKVIKSHRSGVQNLLSGGYAAIQQFLSFDFEAKSEFLDSLYNYMKRDCVFQSDYGRRQGSRSVVEFFASHSMLFKEKIASDVLEWTNYLNVWFKSSNIDDSKAGFEALIALNRAVGRAWAESTEYPVEFLKILNRAKDVLDFEGVNSMNLSNSFKSEVSSSNSFNLLKFQGNSSKNEGNSVGHEEIKLGIYTIGFLAPTAATYMNPKEFKDLFLFLLQRIEYLIFVQDSKAAPSNTSKNFRQLSISPNVFTANSCDYVEAITPFLESFKSDIHQHLNQFKRVIIILIKMFPFILAKKHEIVVNTLKRICHSINSAAFEDFIKDVIKQGVIWTCSHNLSLENEILDVNHVTLHHYLPLWFGLLDVDQYVNAEKLKVAPSRDVLRVKSKIFNELVKNLLYMSDKLNLKLKAQDLDHPEGLQPEKGNDFVIFANLSEFFVCLFDKLRFEFIKPWFDTLIDHLIRKSLNLPLVSGFYKLLSALMRFSDEYFTEIRVKTKEHVKMSFENLKNYFKHPLKSVHRFKNDLQVSCLMLIFAMPTNVISASDLFRVYDFVGIFSIALKLGRNHYLLANCTLDTLEKWYTSLPEEVMLPLIAETVPFLNGYLRNQFVSGDSFHVEGRKLKKFGGRKLELEAEPELVRLQHKILRFLAILPTDLCLRLVGGIGGVSAVEIAGKANDRLGLKEDVDGSLKILLRFGERGLHLWLDPFLEHVLALCLECSDRKVRITACELLHSIVAVFLGNSVMGGKENFAQFAKLTAAILKLAADQDATVIALFHPLLQQMAHFYAHRVHGSSTYARVFIKILMDGVSNGNDSSVRDTSGETLREFIAWTRKQNTKTTLKNNLTHVQLIIDHVQQFSLHPSESKRFGATVIFNNIYRELREEDIFIDAFWLDILYAFVINLSLVTRDDDNLLREINLCLDRVTRCLLQKEILFRRVTNERHIPPKFNGNSLTDVARFLLEYSTQKNEHCRVKCMEIFKKLPSDVCELVLKDFNLENYAHDLKITPFFNDVGSIEEVLGYFESLTCFIDAHVFLIEVKVSYVDVLASSRLWQVLDHLLDGFKEKNLRNVQGKLNISNDLLVRRVKDDFVHLRQRLGEKIIELFEVILKSECVNHKFVIGSDKCWIFLADFLFDYRRLGFTDLKHNCWEVKAERLFKLFLASAPSLLFGVTCGAAISKLAELEENLNIDIDWSTRQIFKGLIVIQRVDLQNSLNLSNVNTTTWCTTLSAILGLNKMADDDVITVNKLNESQKEYFALKLEILLNEGYNSQYQEDFLRLVNFLSNSTLVYSPESKLTLAQGFYVFCLFRKTFLAHFMRENKLVGVFSQIVNNSSVEVSVKYVREFLGYVYTIPRLRNNKILHEDLINCVRYIWPSNKLKTFQDSRLVDDDVCLALIYELRMVVDELQCEVMLDTVVAILLKRQDSDVQQMHHLTRVVRVLGMVAPRGHIAIISIIFKRIKRKNCNIFKLASRRVTTTLFIKTLFDAAMYSWSLDFFYAALDFYIVFGNDFEVNVEFCKEFMRKLPVNLQAPLLERIFSSIERNFQEGEGTDGADGAVFVGYNFKDKVVLTLCLCNLIAQATYEVFEEFYVRNISIILGALLKDDVLNKTTSCILLNRLFGSIDVENMETCKINLEVLKAFQKGLTARVVQLLLAVVKEKCPPGGDLQTLEEFRVYQCYAYNALATLICNCHEKLKQVEEFYKKLFARLDPASFEDILWVQLVPEHLHFDFDILADDIPKKRRVLTDIHTKIHIREESASDESDFPKFDYIESQNLFLSTLAEDITNYDFTNVSVRHEEVNVAPNLQNCPNPPMQLEIYDENINSHECMLQICGVIKHLHEIGGLIAENPPQWLDDLSGTLLKSKRLNVRQFLCKIVENSQHFLQPFGKLFIPGIVRTINDSDSLNSLNCDCIVMLVTTWKDTTPTRDDLLRLIQFLMINLWNDRLDVFKYNVNLLKTVIETYKDSPAFEEFSLPDGFVDSLFPAVDSKTNMAVVHVVNILLVNNVSPFPRTLQTFCRKMTGLLHVKDRNIYKATAETLGLCLRYLENCNHGSLTNFRNKISDNLQAILKESNVKFVEVLECVVKGYPQLGGGFLSCIGTLIGYKNVTDISRIGYLRIYLKCIDQVIEAGLIDRLEILQWLGSSHVDTLIVTLEIVLRAVDYFDESSSERIVKKVVSLINSNRICRLIRVDVLIAFYKRFSHELSPSSSMILGCLKEPLIAGFVDSELEIRTRVHQFWALEAGIPWNLEDKFIYLLKNLYDTSSEEIYLPFCIYLMLNAAKQDEVLFAVPLHQCDFVDYEVNSNWRVRNSAMLPMFTASSQEVYLKATQSYQFEQTQQSKLDTQRWSYSQGSSAITFSKQLALAVEGDKERDDTFLNPNDFDISVPKVKKWRFFKNKADVSRVHAIREIHKTEDIQKRRSDAKKMKEGQVKIYRKYRRGDFPDIQIEVRGILDTLKELSRNDGNIAMLLFKGLFGGIIDIAGSDSFVGDGSQVIGEILMNSTEFDGTCIGALLQIALEHNLKFAPDLIRSVAVKSGNIALGCLLLEEYLVQGHLQGQTSTLHWMRLADLYKKLEEWDVVQAIFMNHMPDLAGSEDLMKTIKMAVEAESSNYWDASRRQYIQLIQKDQDDNRRDFYYESFFKCSEELADWRVIEKRCEETLQCGKDQVFTTLWSSEWNKEILLPYYFKSKVRLCVGSDESDFEPTLKEVMKDGAIKGYLQNQFSDELSLLYLDKLRIKMAGNYAENHGKRFLKQWRFTKGFYTAIQEKLLLNLKNSAEISVLLRLYDRIGDGGYGEVIDDLERLWLKTSDGVVSTQHLIGRLTVREAFVNLAKLKLQSLDDEGGQELQEDIARLSQFSLGAEVDIIKTALKQKNLHLAKFYAKKVCSRTEFPSPASEAVSFLLYSKVALLRRQYIEGFRGHYRCVTHQALGWNQQPKLAIDAALHLIELCKEVHRAVESSEVDLEWGVLRKAVWFDPSAFDDASLDGFSDLLMCGFENLRVTLEKLDLFWTQARNEVEGEGESRRSAGLAELADAFLVLAEEYDAKGCGYENRYIECALKSMEYGSERARLSFPKLLDVDGLMAIHGRQFIEQTSNIPSYMFISWIPQLLAYCDTDRVSVIKHIVLNLAKQYPNAIIYAYKLSKEKFTYIYPETQELTAELDEILHNELIDKMLAALKHVAVPSTIIRTAVKKLRVACKMSEEEFKMAGQQILTLFDDVDDPMVRGETYQHVMNCKERFMSIINYSTYDKDSILAHINDLPIPNPAISEDLGHYSPWLNYFHSSDHEREIEVPGCYNGLSKPLPQYHPKISKFSTDVKVFHSQVRPIRITIYANDVKEYRFLVKYGEDLRQDQRIQQLFKLMNVILDGDVKCRERKLNVATFEVIPLTGELGFIQWVDETEILKRVIVNPSGYVRKHIEQKMQDLRQRHVKFWTAHARNVHCSAQNIEEHYEQLVKTLPWDALRKSLWNISPDPETFFGVRSTFLRSYAVMCITNWLLGIGDRHLENILLNMDTGSVIGIDFGHAFGSATQQQELPELVPFRLTPQIVNLAMPFKDRGILRQAMIHTLRVLRQSSKTLLSTMNIFIVEPTLNWATFTDDSGWSPVAIMSLARDKFDGRHPIDIMIDEVKARRCDTPETNRMYVECLMDVKSKIGIGVPSINNIDESDGVLSVHEQVDCLIAQATDANLLGRMFYGWEPWV